MRPSVASTFENETRRIIVEFGEQRKKFELNHRFVSVSVLSKRLGELFRIDLTRDDRWTLQIFNYDSNRFQSFDEKVKALDVKRDLREFHRFKISRSFLLLDELRRTTEKIDVAAKNVQKIQRSKEKTFFSERKIFLSFFRSHRKINESNRHFKRGEIERTRRKLNVFVFSNVF